MKLTKTFLVIIFILLFIPLYWMIVGSFQNLQGVMVMPPKLIPSHPILDNYIYLLKDDFFILAKNTLVVVIGTVILSAFVSLSAGYAFAAFNFKLKKIIWMLFLSALMIPRISLIIPLFTIIKKLGIQGTLAAVILPIVFSPLGIYLARNYFESIPRSILESARIDGANEWQILWKIVTPVSKPIVSALSLFAGVGALQDYIWQMLVLQNPLKQTLLVGIMRKVMLRGIEDGGINVNPVGRSFAAAIILLFPLLIIFIAANKYFINSLGGAIKE